MTQMQLPRWFLPAAGGAFALWAVTVWWMVASLESPNEAQANAAAASAVAIIEDDVAALRAEIAALTSTVAGLGDQVASSEQQRQTLASRVQELESAPAATVMSTDPDGAAATVMSTDPDGDTVIVMSAVPDAATIESLQDLLLAGPEPDAEFTMNVIDPWFTDGKNLYNCSDFESQVQAQAAYDANAPGDPNYLDGDKNGIACEQLK